MRHSDHHYCRHYNPEFRRVVVNKGACVAVCASSNYVAVDLRGRCHLFLDMLDS